MGRTWHALGRGHEPKHDKGVSDDVYCRTIVRELYGVNKVRTAQEKIGGFVNRFPCDLEPEG